MSLRPSHTCFTKGHCSARTRRLLRAIGAGLFLTTVIAQADDTVWNKYNNVAPTNSDTTSTDGRLGLGNAGKGDELRIHMPTVIKDGSTYKMWYTGTGAGTIYRIYHATSPDGLTWTKYTNAIPGNSDTTSTGGRIPLGTANRGDDAHALLSTVIKDGATYKMWYAGHDGANMRIYYATSPDGFTWSKYNNTNPPNSDTTSSDGRIPLGASGTGDDFHASYPSVIKDGGTYKMWYSGSDGANYRIYYATSSDGLTWTKYSNSIPTNSNTTSTDGRIPLGTTGRGDTNDALAPAVIKDGGTYKMWYSGKESTNYCIYYATSPDGLTWTKYDNSIPSASNTNSTNGRIPLGTAGKGDEWYARESTVIKDGYSYKMWYSGVGSPGGYYRIYHAYTTPPAGTLFIFH